MGIQLKPAFDMAELARQAEMFPKAGARALNKTIKSARANAAKDIRATYKIKSGDVKETMTISKASISKLKAALITTGKRLALYMFNARQNRQGVAVTVSKGNRSTITGAFIATMKSGHVGVFSRTGDKSTPSRGRYAGTGAKRQPITERYTISAPEMMGGATVTNKTNDYIEANLPKTLAHEIEFYKSQGGDE